MNMRIRSATDLLALVLALSIGFMGRFLLSVANGRYDLSSVPGIMFRRVSGLWIGGVPSSPFAASSADQAIGWVRHVREQSVGAAVAIRDFAASALPAQL